MEQKITIKKDPEQESYSVYINDKLHTVTDNSKMIEVLQTSLDSSQEAIDKLHKNQIWMEGYNYGKDNNTIDADIINGVCKHFLTLNEKQKNLLHEMMYSLEKDKERIKELSEDDIKLVQVLFKMVHNKDLIERCDNMLEMLYNKEIIEENKEATENDKLQN